MYPIAFDIVGKPTGLDRDISGDRREQYFDVRVEVTSRYPSEVDRLCYGLERGIMLDRKYFGNSIDFIDPNYTSPLHQISPEMYMRELGFIGKMYVSRG